MTENSFIKKMAKGILRNRKKAFFDRSIMHPAREWFLGFTIGLIILGVGVFWSVSTYSKFSHIYINGEGGEDQDVIYKASMVETALADFAARKKAYEGLKNQLIEKYKKFDEGDEATTDPVSVTESEISSSTPVIEAGGLPKPGAVEEVSPTESGAIKFE